MGAGVVTGMKRTTRLRSAAVLPGGAAAGPEVSKKNTPMISRTLKTAERLSPESLVSSKNCNIGPSIVGKDRLDPRNAGTLPIKSHAIFMICFDCDFARDSSGITKAKP